MKKHWKQVTAVGLFILALVPLTLFSLRTADIFGINARIEERCGELKWESPYRREEPMEELRTEMRRYSWINYYSDVPPTSECTVELPCDLHYYTAIGEKEPVLVLPKGTTVLVRMPGTHVSCLGGYGTASLPTYKAGWRYVCPFREGEKGTQPGKAQLAGTDELPAWYYIRTEELDTVFLEAAAGLTPGEMAAYAEYPSYGHTQGFPWLNLTAEYGEWEYMRFGDFRLCWEGMYRSPELHYPVFDRTNSLLLGAGLLPVGGGVALLCWKKKKN